mmetsp:Transcript_87431/g.255687  ORF Transcript_87431/g.255687 Transcript_87431/m.255687 type:complete len:310 (+) Transcript_87431:3-932(+)
MICHCQDDHALGQAIAAFQQHFGLTSTLRSSPLPSPSSSPPTAPDPLHQYEAVKKMGNVADTKNKLRSGGYSELANAINRMSTARHVLAHPRDDLPQAIGAALSKCQPEGTMTEDDLGPSQHCISEPDSGDDGTFKHDLENVYECDFAMIDQASSSIGTQTEDSLPPCADVRLVQLNTSDGWSTLSDLFTPLPVPSCPLPADCADTESVECSTKDLHSSLGGPGLSVPDAGICTTSLGFFAVPDDASAVCGSGKITHEQKGPPEEAFRSDVFSFLADYGVPHDKLQRLSNSELQEIVRKIHAQLKSDMT